jgi:hypothetical protein
MRADIEAVVVMTAGLDRIRRTTGIPDQFPTEVMAAAERAVTGPTGTS